MSLNLPRDAEQIIDRLNAAGFEAYAVGGCVRDMLLNKVPFDYDITTSARPDDIKSLFEKTIDTGIKHGTVTVIVSDKPFEVTTYRTERGYSDHRHPEKVEFINNLKEDLARRDFTVNAMAYNKNSGVVDYFGGIKDLENKILRTVGDPAERFSEDALRILRLYRFSSTLDFCIEEETAAAALTLSGNLKLVSVERICTELKKAVNGKNPQVLSPLIESGALEFLGVDRVCLSNLCALPQGDIRLFAFLYRCGDCKKAAKCLKLPQKLIRFIEKTGELADNPPAADAVSVKKILGEYDDVLGSFLIYKSICEGCDVSALQKIYDGIILNKEPYKISHLAISGNDLTELGFSGKEVGEILNRLLNEVIKDKNLNKKSVLLKMIR